MLLADLYVRHETETTCIVDTECVLVGVDSAYHMFMNPHTPVSSHTVVETEEINSTYAQVNWRTHQMPIDPDTVAKLKGKLVK